MPSIRSRTTSGSYERICVVELFGRNSGETSLFAAYLADVNRTLISEIPLDMEHLVRFLVEDCSKNHSNYTIMTISEDIPPIGDTALKAARRMLTVTRSSVESIILLPRILNAVRHT